MGGEKKAKYCPFSLPSIYIMNGGGAVVIIKRDDFIKEIEKISQEVLKTGRVKYNNREFKESFFRQSSHSPDNLKSMEYIEYGVVKNKITGRRNFGLKIKGKDVLLADIIYFLENDDEVRNMIIKEFPELNFEEAEAALRVMTIIMIGFECDEYPDDE